MSVMKLRPDEEAAPASNTASTAPPPPRPRRSRRRLVRTILFLLLPLALIAAGYFYVEGGRFMSTENAYVRADILGISTDVAGIVKEVLVRENQHVRAGDVLFRLDDQPFRLTLARAEAQIGIVTTDLNALRARYGDMQAQIRQAEVDVAFYSRESGRQRQLAQRQVASEAALDQAQRNLQSAQEKVASLTQQLAGIAANLAGDPAIPIERHPRYVDAVAQRDEAARQLAHTEVRAPRAGVVTNVPSLQPGQYLAAAAPAFALVATDQLWVDANPKETELTNVRPGQPVTMTVDTYPAFEWHGTVDSISPASAASFSLLPAQNTSGNWVKVVQRIAMRVRIETPDGLPQLRAGMSVIISVDTGRPRGVPPFLRNLIGG